MEAHCEVDIFVFEAKKCISDGAAHDPNASISFGNFRENGVDVFW
jgi:hypothetical protein